MCINIKIDICSSVFNLSIQCFQWGIKLLKVRFLKLINETCRHKRPRMSGNSKPSKNNEKIYVIIFVSFSLCGGETDNIFFLYSVNKSSCVY